MSSGDTWSSSDSYEYFMGRWSKRMAPAFLQWLDAPANLTWIDLGCGTGALSAAIAMSVMPEQLYSIDPSSEFIDKAKLELGKKSQALLGNASQIPLPGNAADILVSGLALNFFPHLQDALMEMKRVVKQGGIIAAYVWDYAGKMEFCDISGRRRHRWMPMQRSLMKG